MPERRKPTAILERSGAFAKNPQRKRARANEPIPRPFGNCPAHLSSTDKKIWAELFAKLQPGVAGDSDEMAFEVLVCLVGNFRHREKLQLPQVIGEVSQMNLLFSKFGMTPADRSRVTGSPDDRASDPLESIRRAKTASDIVQ